MWFLPNLWNIFGEFLVYLIVDNTTKVIVARNASANRFDILMYECLCLGFLIGFISYYHSLPVVLICLLCIHLIGTLHAAKGFHRLVRFFSDGIRRFLGAIYQSIPTMTRSQPTKQTSKTKPIPQEYLYNYHLKPTNDLRLQQSSFSQSLPRPGIQNLYGTTCSLNALLQSLGSLDRFNASLKRNVNLSRFKYDPIVSSFIDLLSQLQNDQRAVNNKNRHSLVDTSVFIAQLNRFHPNLLTKTNTTDICDLFQAIIDVLSEGLSKQQSSLYSTSVIEQVQNRKLTTVSIEHLNRLFIETEAQLHETITLDSLDAQTSSIMQYIDLTWLLHHIQDGSIVKHCFSGQILHAHCCTSCSHVRFRTEPFQILPLSISKTSDTLERLISQFTSMETINSTTCSYCSNGMTAGDSLVDIRTNQHGNLLTSIARYDSRSSSSSSTLSPIVTNRRQPPGQILSSTPISSPHGFIAPNRRKQAPLSGIKSQTMIANFPEILCIHLKRFSYDRLSQRAMKLNSSILIEPEKILDLSSIHYTTWLGLANTSTSYRYRLNAVCLHLSGNSSTSAPLSSLLHLDSTNGHSVCLYRSDHQRWFLSDDERITEVIHVDRFFQSSYVTENCYLVFYERC